MNGTRWLENSMVCKMVVKVFGASGLLCWYAQIFEEMLVTNINRK